MRAARVDDNQPGKTLLRLSWPARPLWQNYKCHWAKEAKAVRDYREEAWKEALNRVVRADPNADLHIFFHPPDRRRRDVHNMPATLKPAIDGIADAMGVDDQHFKTWWPMEFEEPVKGGCVLIEIVYGKTQGVL